MSKSEARRGYAQGFDEGFDEGEKAERKRILEELEAQGRQCEQAALWANGEDLRAQLQQLYIGLQSAINVINGEKQ